jgi:predicted N-formylglutamate amidohydrolase
MQLMKTAEPETRPARGESFDIQRGAQGGSACLILCDHATNRLPPEYGALGLDAAEMQRHIAYDIGAQGVALEMGRRLGATVVSSNFSRLLIDANRGEDDPTLIMQISDGAVVPGNARVDEAERGRRIARFFTPYHDAIAGEIDAALGLGVVPIIVSIHSFTETWRGVPRKWAAAVLWDKDPRLAVPLLHELRERTGLEIGDNEPYSGYLRNDTIFRHATLRGLPNALIEIRQDLIREEKGQREWAALLCDCAGAILADPASSRRLSLVEYFGSFSDIEAEHEKTRKAHERTGQSDGNRA